jgi:hypothetical protein
MPSKSSDITLSRPHIQLRTLLQVFGSWFLCFSSFLLISTHAQQSWLDRATIDRFRFPQCAENRTWSQLASAYSPGTIISGGLGQLSSEVFDVWACFAYHPCLSVVSHEQGDLMCYVFNEEENSWYPWCLNSELVLCMPPKSNDTETSDSRIPVLFPPGPLRSSSTILTQYPYGNGQYATSASSFLETEYDWNAFDGFSQCSNANQGDRSKEWTTFWFEYDSDGSYLGSASTMISGITYNGAWLQIRLSESVTLSSYKIYTRSDSLTRGPRIFSIAGSIDGLIWSLVDFRSDSTPFSMDGKSYNLTNTPEPFSHYRLIVTAKLPGDSWLSICEWELYAVEHISPPL